MGVAEKVAEVGGGVKNLAIGLAVLGVTAAVVYVGYKIYKGIAYVGEKKDQFVADAKKTTSALVADTAVMPKYDSLLGALTGISSATTRPKSGDNFGIPTAPPQFR